MGSFKNRLAAMQENWDENRESTPDVPAGIYTMQLQNAELVESQSSGRLQIAREHLVIEGEYAGQVARDYMQLETDRGPQFIARWIELMGYQVPEEVTELEEVVSAIADAAPTYTAQVKISDSGFTNVNVKQVIDDGEAGEPAEGGEPEKEKPGEKEEKPEKEEENDTLTELIAFAQSQDIDVDDEDDEDSVTEKILEFEWEKDELIEEEVTLLESIDAIFTGKPKPKKKVVAKKAVKKASKTATKNKKRR